MLSQWKMQSEEVELSGGCSLIDSYLREKYSEMHKLNELLLH